MYKIKLDKFEGPLDLLLFFVRKDELNIYDIPIAHITKSYLEYLKLMHELNLDIASEFILMAATLMRIKVRCMLPPEPGEEPEEEPLDPREELTRRLIEYRQFKEASRSLSELDDQWRMIYRRNYFDTDRLPPSEEPMGLKNISFFDLLTAYKKAVAKTNEITVYHDIERLNVTVEQQIKYIGDYFDRRQGALFTELCEGMSKIEIVVTFLALLDMIRNEMVFVRQSTVFDDIWIQKERPEENDLPDPVDQPSDEKPAQAAVAAENVLMESSPEEAAPEKILAEEYDLDQQETDTVISDFDAESETQTPVEETDLQIHTVETATPAEELADISCLTDQLKSPFETEIEKGPEETVSGYEPGAVIPEPAETLSSSEKWIEDVPASMDHEQLKFNAAHEDQQAWDQSYETLTESPSAAVAPEITDEERAQNILNTGSETLHGEIPVDYVDSVSIREETETAAFQEKKEFSDIRDDETASDTEIDNSPDRMDTDIDNRFDKTAQEKAEQDLMRENVIIEKETLTEESGEEKDQDHSGEYPQDQKNIAFTETVTEDSAPVESAGDIEELLTTEGRNSAIASDFSGKIHSGYIQAESITTETIPAKEIFPGEPSKDEEIISQPGDSLVSPKDEKTTEESGTGELYQTEDENKPHAADKPEADPKTSVIRKIFTKVLSFVKKIFKR